MLAADGAAPLAVVDDEEVLKPLTSNAVLFRADAGILLTKGLRLCDSILRK